MPVSTPGSISTDTEYELALGDVAASITATGAGLRAVTVGGVDIIEPFPAGTQPVWSQGALLAPWPNRIRDGRWTLDGEPQQLELTEPALGNAIHGLVMRELHEAVEVTESSVTLVARMTARPGYPFLWENRVRYSLVSNGIDVAHTLVNLHDVPIPMAVGVHTYLAIGGVPTGELALNVEASQHMAVDDRLNPIGLETIDPEDLRDRRVGDLRLDDAYSGLAVHDGRVRHSVRSPDGRVVELWADERFGWVQVFTTDRFPGAAGPRTAIAVEPMTAPADALNSGLGTEWVSPGDEWSVRWGLTLL